MSEPIKKGRDLFGGFFIEIKGGRMLSTVSTLPLAALAVCDERALSILMENGAAMPSSRAFWREKKRLEETLSRASGLARLSQSNASSTEQLAPMVSLWQKRKLSQELAALGEETSAAAIRPSARRI